MKKITEVVFYSTEKVEKISYVEINELKKAASLSNNQKSRLCTHENIDSILQEMFIIHKKDYYVRPHKHINKNESIHIIEGEADIILFDDCGNLTHKINLGDYRSGLPFYFKIAQPIYHTLIIKSPVLVFHETTIGPFDRSDTIFAPWSPDANAIEDCNIYITKLNNIFNETNNL